MVCRARRLDRWTLLVSFVSLGWVVPGGAQVLDLPPRSAGAPGGSQVARELRDLDLEAREERAYSEIVHGNIPSWLRALVTIEMIGEVQGEPREVTLAVMPDYLAIGSDRDYFLMPLSPQTAQRVADLVGGSLPTPPIVDAIWAAADVRLAPTPIPPGPRMTTVAVFEDHDRAVGAQRARAAEPMGALVAGHKKDVVITAELAAKQEKVAIYGWHRRDGRPIQPLYTGHTDRWVDYSHGIRIVSRVVLVDGVRRDLADLLTDPVWAPLLSDGGVIDLPRYAVPRSPAIVLEYQRHVEPDLPSSPR